MFFHLVNTFSDFFAPIFKNLFRKVKEALPKKGFFC